MAPRPEPSASSPRTLADQFRSWSDEDLVRLLTARPDLATPAPQDSAQLASRAGTRASTVRAVDQLSVLELTVVESLVGLAPGVSVADVQQQVNATPEVIAEAVEHLVSLALVWGPMDALRPLSVLGEIVGTTCLLYTSPSPRDGLLSRMPSSA